MIIGYIVFIVSKEGDNDDGFNLFFFSLFDLRFILWDVYGYIY